MICFTATVLLLRLLLLFCFYSCGDCFASTVAATVLLLQLLPPLLLFLMLLFILLNCHAGFIKKGNGIGVRIGIDIDDMFYAGVDNHFCAQNARLVGAVEGGAGGLDAVNGGLDDRVLLGMDGAAFFVHCAGGNVLGNAHAANIQAMGKASRSAVVTGGQNPIVTNNNGTDFVSQTG
jgi:hypothetical protein